MIIAVKGDAGRTGTMTIRTERVDMIHGDAPGVCSNEWTIGTTDKTRTTRKSGFVKRGFGYETVKGLGIDPKAPNIEEIEAKLLEIREGEGFVCSYFNERKDEQKEAVEDLDHCLENAFFGERWNQLNGHPPKKSNVVQDLQLKGWREIFGNLVKSQNSGT